MSVFRKQPWQGPDPAGREQQWGKPVGRQGVATLHQPPAMLAANAVPDPYSAAFLERRTQTVCFTGHRAIGRSDAEALAELDTLLDRLYAHGYRDFLCGGALGFDLYAAERVVAFRDVHPDVRLIFCIPCEEQTARWQPRDQARYARLTYLSDEVRVLSRFYYDGCMQVRNQYMVDRSSICVAYMKRLRGGTLSTVRYAVSQDLILINLAVPDAVNEYTQAFP